METYIAPKNQLYVHKDNFKLYGEAVVIREEDDYTIDDFELLNKKEYLEKLKNKNSEEEN
jgi:hypothetical protein